MSGIVAERLGRNRVVCIDSMTFIYFIEEHRRYLRIVQELFRMVDQGMIGAFSSYLTLMEVLVRPLRMRRPDLVEKYRRILLDAERFRLFPINGEIAERGAEIRARYGFRTPDALQLATGLCNNAGVFVTNDSRLKRFRELDILLLEELTP